MSFLKLKKNSYYKELGNYLEREKVGVYMATN